MSRTDPPLPTRWLFWTLGEKELIDVWAEPKRGALPKTVLRSFTFQL
jgi:hypothetical protein